MKIRASVGSTASLSVFGKVIEKILPETISKHFKDKEVISSQHRFSNGKSCLTNLIIF